MTYQETIAYLFASQPAFHLIGAAAYKPGLDNTIRLMEHLDNPHRKFRAIHIAGTNGKGSNSHLIAAALQCAGYKVGLYTSPHLVDFRERIRVNGEMIAENDVVRFVEENREFLDTVKPSFFESTMAMAFQYFAEAKVDIAVIEVGLGGRLDSTNILEPYDVASETGVMLSVITNIGFDHTEFLGNTLAQIANEKAGIIKQGVPCVIGETDPETAPVFLQKAKACGLYEAEDSQAFGDAPRIYFADQCTYLKRCRERDIHDCQLHGIYQDKNMQTTYVALCALREPLRQLTTAAIAEGFKQVCTLTGLRGRWEQLAEKPTILCDTGHNSHGIKYVAEQLKRLLTERQSRLHIVFGMVNDKDVDVVLHLLPAEAHYYFTAAATHRAISAEDMEQMFLQVQPNATTQTCPSVQTAIETARHNATEDDIIFIGGSNYVVGEALRLFPQKS